MLEDGCACTYLGLPVIWPIDPDVLHWWERSPLTQSVPRSSHACPPHNTTSGLGLRQCYIKYTGRMHGLSVGSCTNLA